ncbi:NTP transferase domain-containing protein [Candidatus Gottesmanbacteria bacterium]|nr:NTP transferase domain-containing protein [Candidatus Gottesmanbacteria bacterium]
MKALILAAGFGTRLQEVIHDRPKVMAPVNGKPFLEYLLLILRKHSINKVVIATGYLGGFIKEYFGNGSFLGIDISYSHQRRPVGTGGAVALAEREGHFNFPYFVVNGDTFIDIDFKKLFLFHNSKKTSVTLTVSYRKNTQSLGIVNLTKSKVKSFKENSQSKSGGYVNCGVYVFTPGVIKPLKDDKRFSLEKEFFPRLAREGRLGGFETRSDFIDIGVPNNYYRAIKLLTNKKRKVYEVRSPVRVSLAGGGSDLPEYFNTNGGCVIGFSISKYAYVRLSSWDLPIIRIKLVNYNKEETYNPGKFLPYDNSIFDLFKGCINLSKPKAGFEVSIWTDFPAASGLGSSSAVSLAFLKAISLFSGKKVSKQNLAKMCISVERDELKIPGGWQDQYLCSLGGVNFISFSQNNADIKPLKLPDKRLQAIAECLVLVSVKGKRFEANQQKHLLNSIVMGENHKYLEKLKIIAKEISEIIRNGDVDKLGDFLDKSWQAKKKSSPVVTTSGLDKIYSNALKSGASGGKLLGSGGGGFMLFHYNHKGRFLKYLVDNNMDFYKFKIDIKGVDYKKYHI